ncbi:hypothetical protein BN8_06322 [Fibrisoma limi BUZ 3]|uniref:DUF4440 domain-containing protein n=2 Tax=Fibrisoma limi TaxID=663275 RepID=I2GSQ3_9BACT|nr:hypothetical protein BN8_06322 [Fibrisoma limi BUZ 3]
MTFIMKLASLLVITFFFATTAFAQQTTDPTQDPTALGNAFFKAMLDEDGNTMGKLLANDFFLTSFDGQGVERDLLLQAISGGYVVIDNGTVSEARTRTYNNSAVMTGFWKVKGNVQGNALDYNAAFSVVCAKQGDAWKIVNVQFTPVR